MADSDKCGEVMELKRRFNDHLENYSQYKQDEVIRNLRQDQAHEKTMEAIAALTEATKGAVDAMIIANGIQKFLKWLSGFAILAGTATWFAKHFKDL